MLYTTIRQSIPLKTAFPAEINVDTPIIIIIINLTPFELKAMRVSYKSLKLGKTLLFA